MASQDGDARSKKAEEVRRNRLNMEKMIMKNVVASRSSIKNRAQQIVETLKKKKRAQQDDDDERLAKKNKPSPPSTQARAAVVAGILSPARRSTAPGFASPARRPNYAPQQASPARPRSVNPLLLSSPVRPPRSAVLASPGRPKRTAASPMRRSEFLTSPLRHRVSASPKRPLEFEDNTSGDAVQTNSARINGHPPLLVSALEQVEVAKTNNVVRSAKSPFQSFQAKFSTKQSPARPAESGQEEVAPRSGPTMVDLSHSDETAVASATSTATSVTLAGAEASAGAGKGSAVQDNDDASLSCKTPTQAAKPVRKLFSSRPVVAQKSICFSTEGVATAIDVSPDGEIIVVGFTDGSVRLYEMDSSVPSDRHGYLLGHIDEQSSQGSPSVQLRVKITSDGRYVFVGCRQGPRVIMSINLDHYRSEKEGDDEDFQQIQKHFYSSSRLRGFADVTTYVRPTDALAKTQAEISGTRSAYYILTGLGVGNLNLWRFVEPKYKVEPTWEHLQNFGAGGNTAMTGAFLPSSVSPGVLSIAAVCKDKNLRMWPLEFNTESPSSATESNENSATDTDDTEFLGGSHTVNTHFNIQNTTEIVAIHGQYAYGISLMGEAYRICFPDASNLSSSTAERLLRQEFELEKLGSGGNGKSRRSNIMLESLSASDDGKAIIAVSTEGIFYYSNKLPGVGSSDLAMLRIIGKNASENALFKTPMKVYTPTITLKGKKTKSEALMAVVTNPMNEEGDGYFNVDPTELFAARWMVPSRGKNCWVCGVRNVSHWSAPPESKVKHKKPSRSQVAELKEQMKAQRRRERAIKRAQIAAAKPQFGDSSGADTPSSGKGKTAAHSSSKGGSALKQVQLGDGCGAPRPSLGKARRVSQSAAAGDDEDEGYTGSDDNTPSVASLMKELEHFKKRNAEIKTEWQRRLQGERQLRRKWKQREEEFLDQLNDSLTKLDAAEVEVDRLRVLLRDAEKRFAFEKARAEQENSVKARYEQLCEHMDDKMALVADQKRLLEQTTRSLLTEVDRNVHALRNAVILEKNECVVCKDRQSVTAVVPCGHLCFCEQDAETYRHNCTSEYPTCPICQQEIISLLRIYT